MQREFEETKVIESEHTLVREVFAQLGGQLLLDPAEEVRSLDQQMLSGLKGLPPALQLC